MLTFFKTTGVSCANPVTQSLFKHETLVSQKQRLVSKVYLYNLLIYLFSGLYVYTFLRYVQKNATKQNELSKLFTAKQSTTTEIAKTFNLAQLNFFELGKEIREIRFLLRVCLCKNWERE